jgi:hypothetical protein
MAETTTSARNFINSLVNIGQGPGRQIYQLPTTGAPQQAIQYPLLFKSLTNLIGGRNTNAFNPIEAHARRQFQNTTIPSIAERFVGTGNTAASSGFMGELAKAGTELESQLAAERAKFGQEEERLRQSELDQLLKFGFVPTSENVLMEKPEGEVPKTVGKQISETAAPYIEKGKEVARNIGHKVGKKLGPITESILGSVGMGHGPGGQAKVNRDRISSSAAAQALVDRDPSAQRLLDDIMDAGGDYNASQFESLKNSNKNPLSESGLRKLHQLATSELFNANTDPNIINALRELKDEHDIEKMLKFIETGNVKYIPSYLRNNAVWKDIAKRVVKNVKGVNEPKIS